MEGFGSSVMKKRRSATARRPRPDSQFVFEGREGSSRSSTPSLDNGSKLSSPDQNPAGYAQRTASVNNIDGGGGSRKVRREERKYGEVSGFYGNAGSKNGQSGSGLDTKRSSEGVLALANWRSSGNMAGGGDASAEKKLKKVKLKVCGVVREFHHKLSSEEDASRIRQKLILKESDDDKSPQSPVDNGNSLHGGPSRDSAGGVLPHGHNENSRGKFLEESLYVKEISSSEPVRKSKRVPKRRVLDGALDEGRDDAEIRYVEKLKTSKGNGSPGNNSEFEDGGDENVKKNSNVSKGKKGGHDIDDKYGSSRSAKESRKKSRAAREPDDTDYVEDDEPGSDDGVDPRRKKQKRESVEALTDTRTEPLTTRQRALQSGKGASGGDSLIEFPNGLPPAPPRKQKGKLSEVEQQAKKAEAAQRRRMQVEKAAEEHQAEAIRKIRGQDSNRKKKEEKMRKERDEMAQKRAADSLVLASNSVRWVMGETGTIVTFGEDVGLPSIFESQTSSYPPPREKCAAPTCTNTYKYRDSKLNLPLCSLQCYKAVHEGSETISSC